MKRQYKLYWMINIIIFLILISSTVIAVFPKYLFIRNSSGSNPAYFYNMTYIGGSGRAKTCTYGGTCTPPANSLIFRDSSNNVFAYIDEKGNMCNEGTFNPSSIMIGVCLTNSVRVEGVNNYLMSCWDGNTGNFYSRGSISGSNC